jgi:hypothetical protein
LGESSYSNSAILGICYVGRVQNLVFDGVRLILIASVKHGDLMSRIVEPWIGRVVGGRLLFILETIIGDDIKLYGLKPWWQWGLRPGSAKFLLNLKMSAGILI